MKDQAVSYGARAREYGWLLLVVLVTSWVCCFRWLDQPLLAAIGALSFAPFMIRVLGSPSFALMLLTIILIAGKLAAGGGLKSALEGVTGTLNDPFVIILFAGFAVITLMFGRSDTPPPPPPWSLRPQEQTGRIGEGLRCWCGGRFQRLLRESLAVRLAAMVPGMLVALVSSSLGGLAMLRMAGVRKWDNGAPNQDRHPDEQEDRYLVIVALALCALAPACLSASIWGVYFQTMTRGTSLDGGASMGWASLASYPILAMVLVPLLAWWLPRNILDVAGSAVKTGAEMTKGKGLRITVVFVIAYAGIGVIAGLVGYAGKTIPSIGGVKPLLASLVSVLLIGVLLWRIHSREKACAKGSNRITDFKENEWKLVMHGFSAAISVLIIVMFAASFKNLVSECVRSNEPSCPCCTQEFKGEVARDAAGKYLAVHDPSCQLGRPASPAGLSGKIMAVVGGMAKRYPLSALALLVASVVGIGLAIGTAFGTFALGLSLTTLFFSGFLDPVAFGSRNGSILVWTLISCATFVNQVSPQADNVETLAEFSALGELTHGVRWLTLPPFILSMGITLLIWGNLQGSSCWDYFIVAGVMVVVSVFVWRRRQEGAQKPIQIPAVQKRMPQKGSRKFNERDDKTAIVWVTSIGTAAEKVHRDGRIRGDVIEFYSSDNDRATSGWVNPLKPTLDTLIRYRMSSQMTPNLADRANCLFVMLGGKVDDSELMNSRLLTQSLARKIPVRFIALQEGSALTPLAARMEVSKKIERVDDIHSFYRALVDSLNEWLLMDYKGNNGTTEFTQRLWADLKSRNAFVRESKSVT